jgi:3,4-dihydroxy 2-butanone 4-phosphate synthase/GTP cyclohydrolase II
MNMVWRCPELAAALRIVEARRQFMPKAVKAISEYEGVGVAVFRDSNPHWLSERYWQSVDHSGSILRDHGIGGRSSWTSACATCCC